MVLGYVLSYIYSLCPWRVRAGKTELSKSFCHAKEGWLYWAHDFLGELIAKGQMEYFRRTACMATDPSAYEFFNSAAFDCAGPGKNLQRFEGSRIPSVAVTENQEVLSLG